MSEHEPFENQAAAYALGALDPSERAQFEAHLRQGCALCETTIRDSAEALAALARQAPSTVPPPEVRQRLMRRLEVATERRQLHRAWLRWSAATAAAMVVGGLLAGGWVASRYEARLTLAAKETTAIRQQVQREAAQLRQQAAAYQAIVELLRDPVTRVVALRGLGPNPEARATVIWHDRSGGQLVVASLPPAPAGRAYELWTIRAGRPSPAGVFQVDARGGAVHAIAPAGPVDVFAVTVEPEGGVPAPTGPMVLASR